MSAVVARTASAGRAYSPRRRAARVTHTLLLSVALIVPPGVCGACASGCAAGGNAQPNSPGTGVAFVDAATHGCGSCCKAIPDGLPAGLAAPGGASSPVADAVSGGLGSCCHGATGCDCLLEPGRSEAAVPPATSPIDPGGPMPVAIAVLPWIAAASASPAGGDDVDRRPERPVRVLYGVWRN